MLVAEVALGRWAAGRGPMQECPLLPGEQYTRYNSLVNSVADPTIFVVQHSNQCYPAYAVTYH